jgi:hypothetical protein
MDDSAENDEIRMTNDEGMTNDESRNNMSILRGRFLSFVLCLPRRSAAKAGH